MQIEVLASARTLARVLMVVSGVMWVTVSMRVMSAGHGYRYLLSSVAVGDGHRTAGTALMAYYTAEGTPPGRWLGNGLSALGEGSIRAGDVVEEAQLARLLGEGRDPISGVPLGRAYPTYSSRAERVAVRVARLDVGLGGEQRAAAVAQIESEEAARPTRRAVAGYDLTFSVPTRTNWPIWRCRHQPDRYATSRSDWFSEPSSDEASRRCRSPWRVT